MKSKIVILTLNGITMAYPRSKTVNLDVTEYYHLVSRCVRKCFLCGIDKESGRSYEHRKEWVQNRLIALDQVFCIDICSYAVMSNHTHLVLKVNRGHANQLSERQVLERWHLMFQGTKLTREFLRTGQYPEDVKSKTALRKSIKKFRKRLYDLSWYMKSLNEYIAKRANKEDDCTGHFWEGRYFAQAILDFSALTATMAYVDVNPFRAGLVKLPEHAKYTSLHQRITALRMGIKLKFLRNFRSNSNSSSNNCIDMFFTEYLEIIDFFCQRIMLKNDNMMFIESPPIIKRLNLQEDEFVDITQNIENYFPIAIGNQNRMEEFKKATGRTRIKGATNVLRLYKQNGKKTH